jgi:hypothetical protein
MRLRGHVTGANRAPMLNNPAISGDLSNSLTGCCRRICLDLAHDAAAVSIERPRLVVHAHNRRANTHAAPMS